MVFYFRWNTRVCFVLLYSDFRSIWVGGGTYPTKKLEKSLSNVLGRIVFCKVRIHYYNYYYYNYKLLFSKHETQVN